MPESGGDSDTGKCISNIRGGANPVSLRSTAPSRGRGENVGRFECIYPSFLWKAVPAGRRLGAQSGVKKERLKSTIYESTLSTADAVPLPRWGRLRGATLRVNFYKGRCPKVVGIAIWGNAFPTYGEANPVSLRSTAPSRGRGENVGRFECIYPSFLWKEVPAGRRLGRRAV